jgi:zinc/manganese transport system permease protein
VIAVVGGVGDLLTHAFMRHALLAGIPVAALSGLVGYFMVLRSQVFTGDALSHVAFSGALGALAIGINPRWGLFGATIAVGIILGLLGNRGRADDVVIGTVFAWVLGLGVLALSVYASTAHAAQSGAAGVSVLFGSILGLSLGQAVMAALLSAALVGLVVVIGRPLLFATLDSAVAGARGVRVRALDVGFLALVGATAALATQAVGALLLLGLLSAPAGAARRLTARPYVALWISSGLAVVSMVVGLGVAYVVPSVPPSFAVVASAAAMYALAVATTLRPQRRTRSLAGSYIGRSETVTG